MAIKTVNENSITSIADTIRTKGGTSEQLIFPNGFKTAIDSIPDKLPDYEGSNTVYPSAAGTTLATNGKSMTSDINVRGDSNLVAENIVKGKSIFGVEGIAESEGLPPYDINYFYPAKFTYINWSRENNKLTDFVKAGGDKHLYRKMNNMFEYNWGLQTIPNIDTSNVWDMGSMFEGCGDLKSIPLLDTSKCIRMENMFKRCSSLSTIPLLNTANCTNMSSMFEDCTSLTTIPLLDTSKVDSMGSMFDDCINLTEIPALDMISCRFAENMLGNKFYTNKLPKVTAIHLKNINTNLQVAPVNDNLTREALLEVINNLMDRNGQEQKTLTLGPTLLAKLTEEDKKIATDKNWLLK